MKFSINRKILVELLKSMIRVVPKNSQMPELSGFLVEANEEDGCLYLTATNLECAIQRKHKTAIESGGGFVLQAGLLLKVADQLDGEEVCFEKVEDNKVKIKSGNTIYTLLVYRTKSYPKPEMPFPEETVMVTGLNELYSKTNFAVSTDKNKPSFAGIHLDITKEKIRAVGCDGTRLSIAENRVKSNHELSVTLPKAALSYLVSAVGNDTLEIGLCGSYLTFMKSGMLFTTKIIKDEFIDTDKLISYVKADYLAKIDNQEFKDSIDTVMASAMLGTHVSPIKVELLENHIIFSTENDMSRGNSSVDAVVVERSENRTFWYPAKSLKDIFRVVTSETVIMVSENGYMVIMDARGQYMLTPQREPKIVALKPQKQKKKEKTENKVA